MFGYPTKVFDNCKNCRNEFHSGILFVKQHQDILSPDHFSLLLRTLCRPTFICALCDWQQCFFSFPHKAEERQTRSSRKCWARRAAALQNPKVWNKKLYFVHRVMTTDPMKVNVKTQTQFYFILLNFLFFFRCTKVSQIYPVSLWLVFIQVITN